MKANGELRREARALLKAKWFWRLLTVGLLLNLVAQTVSYGLTRLFTEMGVQTWNDFLIAKLNAARSGLDYTVPSLEMLGQMCGATLFQSFIGYIFGAIIAFGFARAALKAADNDETAWFQSSLEGFRRPFGVAWLMFVMNLRVALWSLLFFVPGLVAAYRYRLAWYLKSEHPDWSAGQCLAESGRLMRGYKWRAFCFDCGYFGWFLLTVVALLVAAVMGMQAEAGAVQAAVGAVASMMAAMLVLWSFVYFFLGRAVFYRALCRDVKEVSHD